MGDCKKQNERDNNMNFDLCHFSVKDWYHKMSLID